MTRHRYVVFGLKVESTWPIPPLSPSDALGSDPDFVIEEGKVQAPGALQDVDGIKIAGDRGRLFLEIDGVGRFELIGSRKIRVDPAPDATRDQVNLYLLGSVFGALLHQRGLLPFHCNAVEVDGAAFLFCGDSGAGKSTLAAYFVDQGYRLLGDDLCALHFDSGGELRVAPGVPRLKLWQDTLENFRRTSDGLKLVPWHDDKFEVPFTGEKWQEFLPVAGIFHLRVTGPGRPAGIYRLTGLQAANAVTANIYRRRLGDLIGAAPFYIDATAQIARRIPIFTMNRKWGFGHFHQEVVAVEERMRQIALGADSVRGEPFNRI